MSKITLQDAKFLCVEYPGRVKNVNRALETLGGEEALASAIENPKKPVELRFRPKDPFSHPVLSAMKDTPGILLKVTRRRKKNDPEDEGTVDTKVIGIVTRTCRFRGMSDYQYVLPAENRMMELRRSMEKGNVKKLIAFRTTDEEDRPDESDNVPPPMFSTRETPFPYGYKQNLPVIKVRVRQRDGTYAVKILQRHQKEGPIKAGINFTNPNVPVAPSMRFEDMGAEQQRVARRVAELFKERPSWMRNALINRLDSKDKKWLQSAINIQSYGFTSGPWRQCYFLYGVDPRTDPKYAIYQQIDCRRRDIRQRAHALPRLGLQQDFRRTNRKAPETPKERTEEDRQNYIFDGKRIPPISGYVMLCDITDPDFQKLIHTPDYIKPKPTRVSGYYYRCVYDRLRTLFKKKYMQLLKEGVADPIPNADEGLAEEIAKEKNQIQEDENEDEGMDEAEPFEPWGETDDPEMANMFKSLRQAGAFGLGVDDIEQLEEYDVDELGDEVQIGDDEDGDEDEPLWKLGDLSDL